MVNAKAFSLLALTQKKEIFKNLKDGKNVREQLVNLMKYNKLDTIENFDKHMEGWDTILRDKYIENDAAIPCHLVNMPEDFGTKSYRDKMDEMGPGKQFIYAEFLPAGYHEFMIYEQSTDTFWMHEFFVDMNKEEIIPQVSPDAEVLKVYPNVWRPWKSYDPKEIFQMDVKASKGNNKDKVYFQPLKIIRD